MKITIHDISKALNVDSSTVSRALNDSPRVSKKTKEKVLLKASELGYQRNSVASNLRRNKTYTIGVVVPRVSRNFFSNVISGIEETAYESGYNVIICQSLESLEREKKIMNTLLSNRVDGVLISTSMQTENLEHLQPYLNHGGAVVFYDRPRIFNNCSSISINDHKASFAATEHMIKNGCKRIVHLAGPQLLDLYKNRKQGYLDALETYNIQFEAHWLLESKLSESDGINSAKKVLEMENIDGIYSSNDTAAIGAIKHLKEVGVDIPNDIAVVGFNNDPISAVIEPSLTTINQPDFNMGKVASSMLISQIENKNVQKDSIVLDIDLIVRSSSKRV